MIGRRKRLSDDAGLPVIVEMDGERMERQEQEELDRVLQISLACSQQESPNSLTLVSTPGAASSSGGPSEMSTIQKAWSTTTTAGSIERQAWGEFAPGHDIHDSVQVCADCKKEIDMDLWLQHCNLCLHGGLCVDCDNKHACNQFDAFTRRALIMEGIDRARKLSALIVPDPETRHWLKFPHSRTHCTSCNQLQGNRDMTKCGLCDGPQASMCRWCAPKHAKKYHGRIIASTPVARELWDDRSALY